MNYEKKFDINYDYELVLLLSDNCETLIGGSSKNIKKALKDTHNANLLVKDLDVLFREQPLGTFAIDVCVSSQNLERLQELADKLYANLCDKNTNNRKVAETLNNLDVIFKIDKSNTARLIARTISKWYATATDMYMNAHFGLGLKQAERAELGEQFRYDVTELIKNTATTLKKKSPQKAEISKIVQIDSVDISELLRMYSDYLKSRKIYYIKCKLCNNYFLAGSQNSLYCEACKMLRKKNSKAVYKQKCTDEVHHMRQTVKYHLENFIHKSKIWVTLSDAEKTEYENFRKEYIRTSAAMLREYEKSGDTKLENEIKTYINDTDSKRADLEAKFINHKTNA